MLKNTLTFLSLTLLLSGCSSIKSLFSDSKLSVVVVAEPATAELYLNNVPYGQGSSNFTSIKLTKDQLQQGTYSIDIPEARWPSGAVTPQVRKTLTLDQMSHHIVIRHPNLDSAAGQYDRVKSHAFEVTYASSPSTAGIYIDGTLLGLSPATKTYEVTLENYEEGFIKLPAAEARWPSGSIAEEQPYELKLDRHPTDQNIKLTHPAPETPAGKFDQKRQHTVSVRYYSEPSMALLFSERDHLGRAPTYRNYSISFSDLERGYLLIDPIQARWTSGAMTNSGAIKIDLGQSIHELTFIRPTHPNLEVDLALVYREEEKALAEKTDAQNLELMERHYRKMEQFEQDKLQLEKDKLDLLEKQQRAEERERAELLRLRKLEVENGLKQQEAAP